MGGGINFTSSHPFFFDSIKLGRTRHFNHSILEKLTQSLTNAFRDPFLAEITEFLIFRQPGQNYLGPIIYFQFWPLHNAPPFDSDSQTTDRSNTNNLYQLLNIQNGISSASGMSRTKGNDFSLVSTRDSNDCKNLSDAAMWLKINKLSS